MHLAAMMDLPGNQDDLLRPFVPLDARFEVTEQPEAAAADVYCSRPSVGHAALRRGALWSFNTACPVAPCARGASASTFVRAVVAIPASRQASRLDRWHKTFATETAGCAS
jgi:hypothetical protein